MPINERHEQFTDLLTANHGRLVGYVFALVCDFNNTQDIVQQTCLTLWEKFDEFEPDSDFGAWAREVAKNKVLNFYRTQRRQRSRFGDGFLDELAAAEATVDGETYDARREALAPCVTKLSASQQSLLWRYYGGQESVQEIADSLDRTTDGVYGSLRHVRGSLLECITRTLAREDQK